MIIYDYTDYFSSNWFVISEKNCFHQSEAEKDDFLQTL